MIIISKNHVCIISNIQFVPELNQCSSKPRKLIEVTFITLNHNLQSSLYRKRCIIKSTRKETRKEGRTENDKEHANVRVCWRHSTAAAGCLLNSRGAMYRNNPDAVFCRWHPRGRDVTSCDGD